MTKPILPGASVGVLGSGQLGRMFAIAARRLGYRVHTLSPDDDTPTGQIADREWQAAYDDLDAIGRFAREVDVVTFEFENVPAATAQACADVVPVRPSGQVLHVTQNRLREKTFLAAHGFPVTPFLPARSATDLAAAVASHGGQAIAKTAGWGYDGKGQQRIESVAQTEMAWNKLAPTHSADALTAAAPELGPAEKAPVIVEQLIDFEQEVSLVAARGVDGQFVHYGTVSNQHAHHILDVTRAPAALPPSVEREAVAITRGILEQLQVVGVLCVEFFVTRAGGLLVNELAPRPHNSGHFTIDACVTCQFEQQLRAVCGLPLGSTRQFAPAAMANLLGDLWETRPPQWQRLLEFPEVKLHLYGKTEARPGRKMGHLTAMGESTAGAAEMVLSARRALTGA